MELMVPRIKLFQRVTLDTRIDELDLERGECDSLFFMPVSDIPDYLMDVPLKNLYCFSGQVCGLASRSLLKSFPPKTRLSVVVTDERPGGFYPLNPRDYEQLARISPNV